MIARKPTEARDTLPQRKPFSLPTLTTVAPASLVAPGLYLLLTVLLFQSSWRSPTTAPIGVGADRPQEIWFLGWAPYAVSHGLNPLFTHHLNWPSGASILWQNIVLLPAGLLTWPITATLGPIVSYNLVQTLAVASAAWCAYLAIRRYVTRPLAAWLGGLLYGFSPYMVGHALGGNLAHTIVFIPPLMLMLLDEALIRRRRSPYLIAALLAFLAGLQLLIFVELLAIEVIAGLLGLTLLLGLNRRLTADTLPYVARVGLAAGAVSLLLVLPPVVVMFLGPQSVHGAVQPSNFFVSDLLGFIVPVKGLQLIRLPNAVSQQFTGNIFESSSYLGLPLIAFLCFFAVRTWSQPVVRFSSVLAAILALLSMGPTLHVGGNVTGLPLPGAALVAFPVMKLILPVRLMLPAFLFIGLLLAFSLDHELNTRRHVRGVPLGLLAAVALIPLVPKPWPAAPIASPPYFAVAHAQQLPEGAVALIAPFANGHAQGGNAVAMLWQTESGMRFVMPEIYGYVPGGADQSPSPPPSTIQGVMVAVQAGATPPTMSPPLRAAILGELEAWGVQVVVVGPMAHRDRMVQVFTDLLQRPPLYDGGVSVWNVSHS